MHELSYSAVVLVCKDEGALTHAVRTPTPALPSPIAHTVQELLSKSSPGNAQEAEAAQLNLNWFDGFDWPFWQILRITWIRLIINTNA